MGDTRQLDLQHGPPTDGGMEWRIVENGTVIASFHREADARVFIDAAGGSPVARAPFDPASAGWERHSAPGFIDLVGPIWVRREDENFAFAFLAEPKHRNRRGVVQGGMIMTFADRALGTTAWHAIGRRPEATMQLDVHFIDAVRIGEFVEAHCRVVRRTRSVIFMHAALTVGPRTVATAAGVWKVLGAK